MAKKNILIGKIGKTIKFKNIDIRTGGDAPMIFYSTLSRMFPEYNFYFAGPNQLAKLTDEEYEYIFPNKNVFSAFHKKGENDSHKSTLEYLEKHDIKIDFALLMSGMCAQVNIPNLFKNKNGEYAKPLAAFKNYVAPYITTMNNLDCPFYLISEDARYITTNAKDLFKRETLIFSQITGEFEPLPHIKSYEDHSLITENIPTVYSGCEKIFMMALDPEWRKQIDVRRKVDNSGNQLIVISNGCGQKKINRADGTSSSRLPAYKKYVIDNFKGTKWEDTKIYGIWDDKTYENYPQIINKPLVELDDEVADARYSLVYSIMPGFVTVKAWEMIIKGLIPFIHPDYDANRVLNLPEYCYLKDEVDFRNKIEELDKNPKKYLQLLKDCFNCIQDEDLDGSNLINFIMGRIAKDAGEKYKRRPGVEAIFNHFSKDVFESKK